MVIESEEKKSGSDKAECSLLESHTKIFHAYFFCCDGFCFNEGNSHIYSVFTAADQTSSNIPGRGC